jgi:xylulose-5-phosphate/fructose-6-phosphate phosphoketolase
VTQVASMAGDTSADNEAGGRRDTGAQPYVLSNAEGPLDRDELVVINAWWRSELSGGRSDQSVG